MYELTQTVGMGETITNVQRTRSAGGLQPLTMFEWLKIQETRVSYNVRSEVKGVTKLMTNGSPASERLLPGGT